MECKATAKIEQKDGKSLMINMTHVLCGRAYACANCDPSETCLKRVTIDMRINQLKHIANGERKPYATHQPFWLLFYTLDNIKSIYDALSRVQMFHLI